MKKNYVLFFLLILFLNISHSQQSNSEDVGLNLSKIRKNAMSGIKAFDLEDLKYHAKISKSAIDKVERILEQEACYNAYDIAHSMSIYLETALLAEDFNSAQVYLKKTEGLINDAFYEYDICGTTHSNNHAIEDTIEDGASTDLESQQLKLKQQQLALEQKAKAIALQLAQKEAEESQLKKENFITEKVKAINEDIKRYNTLLKSFDCNQTVTAYTKNTSNVSTKSLQDIRTYFLDEIVDVYETYIVKAKKCKE